MPTFEVDLKLEAEVIKVEAETEELAIIEALQKSIVLDDGVQRMCTTCERGVDSEGDSYNYCQWGDDECSDCGGCYCNQAC